MALYPYVSRDEASGESEAVLEEWEDRYGRQSLLGEMLANYPPLHIAHTEYTRQILWKGSIDEELKQLIHVVVSEMLGCDYCSTSHRLDLIETMGFPAEHVERAIEGDLTPLDEREAAAVGFARQFVEDPKRITEDTIAELHEAGFTDDEVFELMGVTGMFLLSSYYADAMSMHPSDVDTLKVEPGN